MSGNPSVEMIDEILEDMARDDFRKAVLAGGQPAVSRCDAQREKLIKARRELTEKPDGPSKGT